MLMGSRGFVYRTFDSASTNSRVDVEVDFGGRSAFGRLLLSLLETPRVLEPSVETRSLEGPLQLPGTVDDEGYTRSTGRPVEFAMNRSG